MEQIEKVSIIRLGRPDSMVVVIPKKFAEQLGVQPKTKINVKLEEAESGGKKVKRLVYYPDQEG